VTGLVPATCELWIDGARYADGQPAELTTDPVALTGLSITWGRKTTVDQPEPATCSVTVLDPPGGVRFDATVTLGSALRVWSALGGQRVIVFDGRVTDLDATYSQDDGGATVDLVAADLTADLGNRYVGDDPWAQETLAARVGRILALAGATQQAQIDPRPAAVQVGRMDADRQGAMNLLTDLATTAGAVLWSAVDPSSGAYLWFEDPGLRPAGQVLVQYPSLYWAPSAAPATAGAMTADDVLRSPVHWYLDTSDLLTRVTVRWRDQTTTPDPTERLVTVVDTAAETAWGAKALSVGTLLVSSQAASELCTGVLAAHATAGAWRSTGLTWDLDLTTDPADPDTVALALLLLDGTARIGTSLTLTDLPDWTPTGAATRLFVEGGTYVFEDGRWVLALDTVPSAGTGTSISYAQLDPSIRGQDFDPALTYSALTGVGPNSPTGQSWSAASGTWAAATGTWMEHP
jgi:hypothetical protein